jgi:hypothetical protein
MVAWTKGLLCSLGSSFISLLGWLAVFEIFGMDTNVEDSCFWFYEIMMGNQVPAFSVIKYQNNTEGYYTLP